MRSDVDLQRAVAMETFATVMTSMLVVPVAIATCDATIRFAHCQHINGALLFSTTRICTNTEHVFFLRYSFASIRLKSLFA